VQDSLNDYERLFLAGQKPYLDAYMLGQPFPPYEVEIQMSSSCNLDCSWCIGKRLSTLKLPNKINVGNISLITRGLIDCEIGGLGISRVKFSGFVGEPLMKKYATLLAMRDLTKAGLEVGLFTNGTLMDGETWDVLSRIEYVHVSQYSMQALDNISGLNDIRNNRGSKLKINVGYVVVPDKPLEVYECARLAKMAGADSLRVKFDIASPPPDGTGELVEICRVRDALQDEKFKIWVVHRETHEWRSEDGCRFQHFLGTIGSDGGVYLCDHHTSPSGGWIGDALAASFQQIWIRGYRPECRVPTCPPYGAAINHFLARRCAAST